MKKVLALFLSFILMIPAGVFADEQPDEPALSKDIKILYTSDVHCGVDQGFGYVGLSLIREQLEAKGNYTLLVDDGDSIQGEPLGTMTTGEADIDLMNAVGYDIAIPGNHEFDYGTERFLELSEKADFPYISCNFNKEGELIFDPYIIKEFEGVKIGFVGVTTPVTRTSANPRYFQDENGNYVYGFLQEDRTGQILYDAVQNAVDAARAEGADYVFVMGHCGNEAICHPWNYVDIISNTSGIDVFLDGHSHDTDQVIMKNKEGADVIRTAVGTKMSCIGCATISAEDGSVSAEIYTWTNQVPAPELLGLVSPVTYAIENETSELNEKLGEVVARSADELIVSDPEIVDGNGVPIRVVRRAETALGDMVTDAYRIGLGTDIALCNGGALRSGISSGDVTLNDILKIHPYGNMIAVSEVTGQQILDALEWGARVCPEENGSFLQVSGLTYEIHTYIDSGCKADENGMFAGVEGERRVKNVMIGGEPLDPEQAYTVAASDFILKNNGDGFSMFEDGDIVQDGAIIDNQVLIDYITGTLGGVIGEEYAEPYGEGRIVAVEEPPADSAAESMPEAAEDVESIAE